MAHRLKFNSRRDERRLVIMMKVENRVFKASSLAMRSRGGTLLAGSRKGAMHDRNFLKEWQG